MTRIKEFKLQVYGFETLTKWKLIPANIQGPTAYIKAVADENVQLPVVKLSELYPDSSHYSLKDPKKVYYGILTIPHDLKKTTINLKAPLILNFEDLSGGQQLDDTLTSSDICKPCWKELEELLNKSINNLNF